MDYDKIMKRKKLILILISLSLAYFCLLILPNATGAENPDMIAVFEVDEYAQYPHALQLLNPGGNIKQSLHNFLVYDHYFYGYPFYFFSGLSLIPFKLISGSDWTSHTQTIMLILRQMVNVLPNILSVWLLTYTATQFKSPWKTIVLFVLLLSSPGLLDNSLWWHPDAIGLLFISLAMFLLRLDQCRYGTYFYLSATAIGVAFGVKYMGAFFFLMIPAYLIIGIILKRINWKKAFLLAVVFVGIMVFTLILSNPLLLLQERFAIIENQRMQFSQTSQGIFMAKQALLINGSLPTWFTQNFGTLPFLALLLIALVLGIARKESRIQQSLLAVWVLPFVVITLNASSQRPHYWLPIFLPLMTSTLIFLPERFLSKPIRLPKNYLAAFILLLISVQIVLFLSTDIRSWTQSLHREVGSASIQFYKTVQQNWINPDDSDGKALIYHDWHVYYPSDDTVEVFMDWDLGNYRLINNRQPDFLLLEKANVVTYGAENYLSTAPDPDRLLPLHNFYRDALLDQFEAYTLIYEDSFGMVFSKIIE